MFKHILAFELRQQFSNPVFWVVASVFALLGFGASSSDAVQIGGGIGNVMRNAPFVIVQLFGAFTSLAMLLVVIFIGASALRDFDNRTAELFFTTPVKKSDYLLGRFGGGFIASLAVMLSVAIGIFVGHLMPWVDEARLGPIQIVPYLWSLGLLVLPNLLFIGGLLFCLAVATRSMLMTYIGVVAFFAISTVTGVLTADLDARWIGALLDPFGVGAIDVATRYWSTSERNTLLPQIDGLLLANRALWTGIGLVFLWLAYKLFRTDREGLSLRRRRKVAAVSGGTAAAPAHGSIQLPKNELQTNAAAQWRQFLHQSWFDAKGVFRGAPLIVMLLFGLMILIINLIFGMQQYGTSFYPTTSTSTGLITGSYALFLIIIVTFYAGELVWRERSQRIAEVTDAFANADWIPLAAKLVALTGVVVAFYATGIVVTMINQLVRGYFNLEPGLYFVRLLLGCLPFVLMGVVALFLQVISNNKFIGYLLMLIYLVSNPVLSLLNFEDNLYRPMGAPFMPYSDMNGYGHFLIGWTWFRLYWGSFAALLFIAAMLFWVRGNRSTWRERVREARRRFTPGPKLATAFFAISFVGLGSWIFYNTHVLNEFMPGDDMLDLQADYEKTYSKYKGLAQPRITVMRTDVDICPEERVAKVRGHYRLINRHATAIPEFVVQVPAGIRESAVTLDLAPHSVVSSDERMNTMVLKLDTPMAPGAEMDFDFTLTLHEPGFTNSRAQTNVVENGTFFNNFQFPQFGYSENFQIVDRNERRKRDLGEVPRMAKIDDEPARANNYISDDADWLDFETTVSTAEDQIALAPGYLQREWVENGRRYFHYTMDVPMLPFAAWLSARWEVKKGDWNGMPIEIYYDKKHAYNVDRMIEASKKSFDYYNAHFTPYQHKQLRILEFPGYSTFAQAFANTVPYSESIGFIADLRDPEDIDYVFYVTAHEVAHQWWAHRVIGADVQGSTMLSESLAQYSALMVMEKEYGAHRMRKFLKYELDGYLRSRATELREELPLALVENQQYIHYQKGSLVFYALRDAIGEDTLNAVLKRFLEDKGFQQPPYTTSRELLAYLREGTDSKFHPLIEDLFEKIIFYDNRVVTATAKKRDDGKYAVTLKLKTGKLEAAGKGEETDVPLDQEIDVGIFARPPGGKESEETVLHFARHRFTGGESTLELVVDAEPFDAGVDPYNKLIDRDSNDNRMKVSVE
jgi:ABC-2 type transport system permease protein